MHATIEQVLQELLWIRAMFIAKQRLSKQVPTNKQQ
jgi:hypothetical protein